MNKNLAKYIFGFLILVNLVIWFAVITFPSDTLRIIACDVGQGDGILVMQGKNQILVDGGPDSKVVDCLGRHMPFWDKNIELVVNTHPQKDHYKGLLDVFERYSVENFLISGLDNSSPEYRALESLIGGIRTHVLYATDLTGMRVGLMHLELLNPSKKFVFDNSKEIQEKTNITIGRFTSEVDPNEFSIVFVLSYGNFDALLTGDIIPETSDAVAEKLSRLPYRLEYLKVPHHGSRVGASQKLIDVGNFAVAVISCGKNNSYGHPHKELLDMLEKAHVKVLRTDKLGDVVIESNGEKWWEE